MRMGTRGLRILLTVVVLFAAYSTGLTQVVSPLPGGVAVVSGGDNVQQAFNLVNNGDAAFHYNFFIQSGGPANGRDARGGPDEMEYEWRDSDEDDGPVYEWIDIINLEATRNLQANDDDSLYGMFDLGFEFPFYGEVYNEIGIDANGFATLLPAFNYFPFINAWQNLPNDAPPGTFLAVNYQDLNPAVGGAIYFWTDGNTAVVTWNEIPHFADGGGNQARWTFQLIINSDGFIKYQYQTVGIYDGPVDMCIGLQNEAKNLGFTVAMRDRDYIQEEKAVAFGPPAAWINWVQVEPQAGDLARGAEQEVVLSFLPGNHEDGYYWANVIFDVRALGIRQITPVVMSLNSPVGSIEGTITDAATNEPVAGALVSLDDVGMWMTTGDDGSYSFANLPPRTYQLSASADNFNDFDFGDIAVEAEQVADGSIELLHGEFTPSIERVVQQLGPDTDTEINFSVANRGNATVHFTTDRRLVGDANAAPMEVRRTLNVGANVDDDRVEGVVFADGHFYICGAAGDATNQVYELDENGEETNRFDQAGHSRYGYKDLEYDGEWIWGAGEDSIFAFNTAGEVQRRFRGPHNPDNNLAWDPVREVLWVAGTTTNISALTRDGQVVGGDLNRRGLRIYGLACFPEDPDGFDLYIMTQPVAGAMRLYKMNPDNNDTAFVHSFDFGDGGTGAGIYITNQLDVYSWVMLLMSNVTPDQGGDKLQLVQLAARRDWMQISPAQGELEANSALDFTLTLDATGLPETEFNGEIVFMHDARGSQTIIPITLNVVLGPVHTIRDYPLTMGWNTISANLQPDNADMPTALAALNEQGLVVMMKDGQGHFYRPADDFNNIPPWDVTQGYQIKVRQDAMLQLEGTTVMADDAIPLHQGWQTVAYYPRNQVEATIGLSGIVEQLQVGKDGYGGFYLPAYDFSCMEPLKEGQGYQLKLAADAELIYQMMGQDRAPSAPRQAEPVHYAYPEPTGSNMSLLLLDVPEGEFAAVQNGRIVGAGVAAGERCGFPVYGDDPSTAIIEGAIDNGEIEIRYWNGEAEEILSIEPVEGKFRYESDGVVVGRAVGVALLPTTLRISSIYPNPFNGQTTISFGIDRAVPTSLVAYDLNGREAARIFDGVPRTGYHTATWNADRLPSGIYMLRLESAGRARVAKVALIK